MRAHGVTTKPMTWMMEGARAPRSLVCAGQVLRISVRGVTIQPCGIELIRHYTYPTVLKLECGDYIAAVDFLGVDEHAWLRVEGEASDDGDMIVMFEQTLGSV
jgi:hypothetical protein